MDQIFIMQTAEEGRCTVFKKDIHFDHVNMFDKIIIKNQARAHLKSRLL